MFSQFIPVPVHTLTVGPSSYNREVRGTITIGCRFRRNIGYRTTDRANLEEINIPASQESFGSLSKYRCDMLYQARTRFWFCLSIVIPFLCVSYDIGI